MAWFRLILATVIGCGATNYDFELDSSSAGYKRLAPWAARLSTPHAPSSHAQFAGSLRPIRKRIRYTLRKKCSEEAGCREQLMDLVIRNARIADPAADGPLDIGIDKGRIVAIEPNIAADADVYDAEGRLASPGLIETHIHLDKSRIIDRCAPQARATLSPVKGVTPLKSAMTVEDVRTRAAQTIEACIKHGTTHMRTQVEVDPGIGMRGFEAIQSLIANYRWAIDIEMCVFPQEGLLNYPGTDELLVEGLK